MLIPAITERKCNQLDRNILALPVRLGGLGLGNPSLEARREYASSVKIKKPLVEQIASQSKNCISNCISVQGGLATAFDLAAFRLSMIAPVKKSVNHSRTVASMRETGWEKQQEAHLRSDSTV